MKPKLFLRVFVGAALALDAAAQDSTPDFLKPQSLQLGQPAPSSPAVAIVPFRTGAAPQADQTALTLPFPTSNSRLLTTPAPPAPGLYKAMPGSLLVRVPPVIDPKIVAFVPQAAQPADIASIEPPMKLIPLRK